MEVKRVVINQPRIKKKGGLRRTLGLPEERKVWEWGMKVSHQRVLSFFQLLSNKCLLRTLHS